MKKIIIVIYIILITSLIGLFIYGNSKAVNYKYYTIKENISVVYEKNRRMSFNVYSESNNSMIIYPEYNSYTLRLDKLSFTLENVEIDVYESYGINVIKITADMPLLTDSELISKKCILDIVNGGESIALNLGTFSYLNSDYYERLSLDRLSGSYSNVDDFINLVGINLTLTNNYEYINGLRIGGYSFGILSKTKNNIAYDNEINIYDINPNYLNNKLDKNGYIYGIKNKMMFIPIGYNINYLTRSGYIIINLDGKDYYFDNFPFMSSDPVFYKYKNRLVEGDIYA